MSPKSNIGRAMEILKRDTYRRHSGVCLEKDNGGWKVVDTNRWFSSWEVACAEIDKRQREMMELIKKQNPQIVKTKTNDKIPETNS